MIILFVQFKEQHILKDNYTTYLHNDLCFFKPSINITNL